jgi:hypothetical protein
VENYRDRDYLWDLAADDGVIVNRVFVEICCGDVNWIEMD